MTGVTLPGVQRRGRRRESGTGVAALAWRLIRYQPRVFATGAALWASWWIVPALVGLLLQAAFDRIAGQGAAGLSLWTLIALLTAVEATRCAVFFVAIKVWVSWWIHSETLMRTNMLSAQLANGATAGRPVDGSGSAVAVFRNDVEDFIIFVDTWLDLGGTAVFAGIALTIMFGVDPTTTLVVVLPLVVAYAVTRLLTERLRRFRRADREATAGVTGFLGNLFSAVLAIKVAGAETAAVGRLRRLNRARLRTALRDRVLTDGLEAFHGSTVDVSIGLVLLLVAPAMRRGDFTVGDLALFASYVTSLAALPRWAGRLLTRHRHAQVAVSRMAALMPAQDATAVVAHRTLDLGGPGPRDTRPRPPSPAAATVALRGVGHRFADGSGVAGVDLDLPAGSFTVVSGPVGSGKTTLLRCLLGLVTPVEGTVVWDGRIVDDLAAHMVPPRCAYLPQAPRLFSATLRDNLTLGMSTSREALADAVRRAALDQDLSEFPEGLDTLIGPRGVRLSGGQMQRTATARALVHAPALLVLDDLSSALDAETERLLWRRLLEGRRPTCLVVSHRAAALERADQVVVLEAGRVRAVGALAELRATGIDPLGS